MTCLTSVIGVSLFSADSMALTSLILQLRATKLRPLSMDWRERERGGRRERERGREREGEIGRERGGEREGERGGRRERGRERERERERERGREGEERGTCR